MSRSESRGNTRQSQFRLGADSLAELDALVAAFAVETGDRETRTSVLRKIIRREHNRRTKSKEGKA